MHNSVKTFGMVQECHTTDHGPDVSSVVGIFTEATDANAAALRHLKDEYGSGDREEHEEAWDGDRAHVSASGFQDETFDISIEASTLIRRVEQKVDLRA